MSRGFTLVELLVSIGIIIIITSMVLVRYDMFDSTILLKNTAYDIALAIREAQVRSVSAVRGNSPESKYPYGVTFTPAGGAETGKEYVTFRYNSGILNPYYDTATVGRVEDILRTVIDRTMFISDVCVTEAGVDDCTITRLDVSFRRPEFKAFFHADGYGGAMSNIESATIVLASPRGSDRFEVKVSGLGQITVKKQ